VKNPDYNGLSVLCEFFDCNLKGIDLAQSLKSVFPDSKIEAFDNPECAVILSNDSITTLTVFRKTNFVCADIISYKDQKIPYQIVNPLKKALKAKHFITMEIKRGISDRLNVSGTDISAHK